jgi:FkbM family methyltransferase
LLNVRPAPIASILKKILRVRRKVIKTHWGSFWVDPVSNLGRALCRDGIYEPGMLKTIEKYLSAGDTFIDLGANEGYFTVLAARQVGPDGCVLAIEPQSRLLPVINQNLRLNDVTSVTVLNVALTDVQGPVTIHLASDTNTGASGQYRMTKYKLKTQDAKGRTLAQVLDDERLSTVDLIKIDIEGAEYEVLLGSSEIFMQGRVRAIALELHPTILEARGKNVDEITRMLTDNGYQAVSGFGNTVWERRV